MERTYKSLIFTNHALARMKDRSITADSVWRVVQHPDRTKPEGKPNTTRFIRTINDRTHHVVATYLPERKKTLIVSTWIRGEEDAVPVVWRLITAPVKVIWWIAKQLFSLLSKRK